MLAAICNVIDAAIYFKEGNYVQGTISLVCAIPGIDDAVGAARSGAKITKTLKMAGMVSISGKSLAKDVRGFAKAADIRINTSSKETADVTSGKNYQYEGVAGCFITGTKLKTENGEKNIEDVESGDYVLAENPETENRSIRR